MNVEVVTLWTPDDIEYLDGCKESVASLGLKHTLVQSVKTCPMGDYNFTSNKFSFAEERNRAIYQVTANWVLMLDADERLSADKKDFEDDPPSWIGGFLTTVVNTSDTGVTKSVRLFRKDAYYIGRCHEQVAPSIFARGWKVGDSNIVIRHIGYDTQERIFHKCFRNIGLLADDILTFGELKTEKLKWLCNTLDLLVRLKFLDDVQVDFDFFEAVKTLNEYLVDVQFDVSRLENEIRVLLARIRSNSNDRLLLFRLNKLMKVYRNVVGY